MPDPDDPDKVNLRVDRLARAMDAARARARGDAPVEPETAPPPSSGSPHLAPADAGFGRDAGAGRAIETAASKADPGFIPLPSDITDGELPARPPGFGPRPWEAQEEAILARAVGASPPEEADLPPLILTDAQQVDGAADQLPDAPPETPGTADPALAETAAALSQRGQSVSAPDLAFGAAPVMLRLAGVCTDIGRYHILHGVDLEVPSGGVTMLLGRNGAGKTTTLRSIMGLWRARAGQISLGGQDITRWRPHRIARAGIGFVPEDMGIFGDLTVAENMALAARSGRLDPQRLDRIFQAFPALEKFWRARAGDLSGGQKQMLSVARVMAEQRRLYLIDEPTKGLAPAIVDTLAGALRDLKQQGGSILMVEQNFSVATELGDTAAIMEDGRIVWAGAMETLAGDPDLQARYMGLNVEAA